MKSPLVVIEPSFILDVNTADDPSIGYVLNACEMGFRENSPLICKHVYDNPSFRGAMDGKIHLGYGTIPNHKKSRIIESQQDDPLH